MMGGNSCILCLEVMNSMEQIKLLPSNEQEYMNRLFAECPEEIKNCMNVQRVEKGRSFVIAGEPCKSIFIILKGRAMGIDVQLPEKIYEFKEFGPGRFLGEFECLSSIPEYGISIRALTDCVLYRIPSRAYLEWMKRDGHALFLRTQKILLDLTRQTRNDRKYLMLECMDRMALYLLEYCEKQYDRKPDDMQEVFVRRTREELSNAIGFSEKTINRNTRKLADQDFLSLRSGKIFISKEQYEAMNRYVHEKLIK